MIIAAYLISVARGCRGDRFGNLKELWLAFKEAFWGLIAPVIILGGIYGGVFTPTEAAAVGVFYGLFVGLFIYRSVTFQSLLSLLIESSVSCAVVMIIVAFAGIFAWAMTALGVVERISEDKISSEIEALEEGIVYQIMVDEGETVAVGATLAILTGQDETPKAETVRSETCEIRATPAARRLARDRGIALAEYPALNATMGPKWITCHEQIHIGIAVALEDGLIVPVIRSANTMSLNTLAKEAKALSTRARQGLLTPDECAGSTFTVTNLGAYGVDHFTPIINQPESAILGVGVMKDRPWVVDGQVSIWPIMNLSLAFDHRLIDGALAARFLDRIRSILEHPEDLVRH